MSRQKLLFIVLTTLLLAACQYPPFPTTPGALLFQDDYAATGSGWDRYADEVYAAGYVNGAYQIELFTPNTDAVAIPHLEFSDVAISVEAKRASGPEDNIFGVICRYQDPANFYFLVISSDGYGGIGVSKEGRRGLISGESLLPHDAIVEGENDIVAICTGYDLTLIVNGVTIAESRAAEWQEGDVGLIAGTYDEVGTAIRFDNFSVTVP